MTHSQPKQEPQHDGWDSYWSSGEGAARKLYAVLASIYRWIFICTRLSYWLKRTFPAGSNLLHAGCGGGQVDALVSRRFQITGLDISQNALSLYRKNNPHAAGIIHADLLNLDLGSQSFDGVYNLGVMEHFESPDIIRILDNLGKYLRPGGSIVLFWPLASAPSVKFLSAWQRWLDRGTSVRKVELVPSEVSLIESEFSVRKLIEGAGWKVQKYSVSPSDLFIQAVLVISR